MKRKNNGEQLKSSGKERVKGIGSRVQSGETAHGKSIKERNQLFFVFHYAPNPEHQTLSFSFFALEPFQPLSDRLTMVKQLKSDSKAVGKQLYRD
jgi:hypothetical protein